jgi:hypothetical protein
VEKRRLGDGRRDAFLVFELRRSRLARLQDRRADVTERISLPTLATHRIQEEKVVTIVFAGAAGWLILLLMCAYAKGRDRRV